MEGFPPGDWGTVDNAGAKIDPPFCDILRKEEMLLIEVRNLFQDGALPAPLLFRVPPLLPPPPAFSILLSRAATSSNDAAIFTSCV